MRAPLAASRWATFGRALLPGIPLGLFQLGLVINGFALAGIRLVRLDWPQSIALGALGYLIIGAIAGFFATWRHESKASAGARAGLYGGAVSLLLLALLAVVLVLLTLVSPPAPPSPPSIHTIPIPPAFGALLVGLVLMFILFLNAIGALLASLSGLFGGWLGHRATALPAAREPASC